jgi:hypothetical protein
VLPGSESLLRALLAQRLDPLLRQAGVAGPQTARAVAPVVNDPRLPSRAALEREVPGAALAAGTHEARGQEHAAPAATAARLPVAVAANTGTEAAPAPPAPTQLSEAARAISALLDSQAAPEPAPVRGVAPLWTSPAPPPAPELARALAQAVAGSGLFYEAHLAQFAQGTRTLAQLQDEPQAKLPPADTSHPSHLVADASAPASAATHATAPAPAAAVVPSPAHVPVLHPGAADLVQQQLQLLATDVFRWSGEPWPGARMDWQVGEDDSAPATEPAGRAWTTRLQVVLPSLGAVDAMLRLDANGALQVRVAAADPRAASELEARRAALVQRLDAAGLRVQACNVEAL